MTATRSQMWKQLKSFYTKYAIDKDVQVKWKTSGAVMRAELDALNDVKDELLIRLPKRPSLGRVIFTIKNADPTFPIKRGENADALLTRYQDQKLVPFFQTPMEGAEIDVDAKLLSANLANDIPIIDGWFIEMDYSVYGDAVTNNTITMKNFDQFKELFENIQYGHSEFSSSSGVGSDMDAVIAVIQYGGHITFRWRQAKAARKENGGSYFPFFHMLSTLDLTRYQVYRQSDKYNDEACLIYSLRMADIDEDSILAVKLAVIDKEVRVTDLKTIAELIHCTLVVKIDDKSTRDRVIGSGPEIHLGLIGGHYFINEHTSITREAIVNYSERLYDTSFPTIRKINKRGKTLTSYEVIKLLVELKNHHIIERKVLMSHLDVFKATVAGQPLKMGDIRSPYLIPITLRSIARGVDEHRKFASYDKIRKPMANEIKPYEVNTPKHWECICKKADLVDGCCVNKCAEKRLVDLYFVDTETSSESGHHEALVISFWKNGGQIRTFYGPTCMVDFMNTIDRKSVIVAHNMMFDFSQFMDHLDKIDKPIQTGSMLKSCKAVYGKHQLVFKDSYSFLQTKLCNIPSMLGLKSGAKEAYPYTLLTSANLTRHIPLNEVYEHLDSQKQEQLLVNAIACDSIRDECLDFLKYTIHYCEQDVRILHDGYLKFRDLFMEAVDLDIVDLISAPQAAELYFANQGVFDGCVKIAGLPHDFCRRAIVGGRCMLNSNKKQHVVSRDHQRESNLYRSSIEVIDDVIQDFDAVSLYPSAMARLGGFPIGDPKLITDDTWKVSDYFIIEIEVTSVGINREFPLLSVKNDSGIRNFTNDIVGKRFVVDTITLADLVEFQHIGYTFVQGYYWDEGVNTKLEETIRYMFSQRISEKSKPHGGCQAVWKLLMNSSYGKLIQKPITVDRAFVKTGDYRNYVDRNYKHITLSTAISDRMHLVCKSKSTISHFAAPHLGCMVLSMSKQIMNEVMCLSEDLGQKIYYQDTDSIHIKQNDISVLSSEFSAKYERALIGKSMGQFHSDFAHDACSVEFIGIAKKVYIDHLQYLDNGETRYDHHIRIKGVPSQCIKDYSSDYLGTYDLFRYTAESINFDLTPYCPLRRTAEYRFINTADMLKKPMRSLSF